MLKLKKVHFEYIFYIEIKLFEHEILKEHNLDVTSKIQVRSRPREYM